MQQQPRRGEPELDLEQLLGRIGDALRGFRRRFGGDGPKGGSGIFALLTFGILGVALIIWLASGIYQVSPGEQAVHRTFGKCCRVSGTGLNWWWPAPIGTKNIESIEEIRSMELGFRADATVSTQVLQQEGQMIAGDLNIVDVPLVVQYRISNLESFLFNVADPGEVDRTDGDIASGRPDGRTLKDATEAALRLVVGQRPIDDVLTDRKEEVQERTKDLLQEILNRYGAGIEVTAVLLQEVTAPSEVREAFQEVNRARQDKETVINQAEAYERDLIPRARGEAEKILQAAEAFKRERIARAEGEAGRFLSILREYEKSKDVTRQRIYLEAMEEILPGVRKFVVSPESKGSIILNAGGQIVPVPLSPTTPAEALSTPTPPGGQ